MQVPIPSGSRAASGGGGGIPQKFLAGNTEFGEIMIDPNDEVKNVLKKQNNKFKTVLIRPTAVITRNIKVKYESFSI